MLTAEEFTERMDRVGKLVAKLSQQSDNPASLAAADLLRTWNELNAAGLQRMLAFVDAGGDAYRPLREKFAQDDLVRSMLLSYDLHPIDLQTRLTETVGNLRPLIESYGGNISIASISRDQVTLMLDVPSSAGPSPVSMLRKLLEHAIIVAAPDVAEIRFDDRSEALANKWQLPILKS